ncbi:MAG: hypothetical protein WCO11_01795 [Sphingomonadales bacterium]|jgi:hypothetical protein
MTRALLVCALLALAACGVEQAQPAPVAADDRWGHLPPDPQRPQQAQTPAPDRG